MKAYPSLQPESKGEGMIIRTMTAVMLCLATLTTGACVTRSSYEAAVADLESTNAELFSTHAQSQLLTQQVSELQQHRSDIARQMEVISLGFQQAMQEMEAERADLQKRLRLNRSISQLTAQQKNLLYALQRESNAQSALQTLVEQYKSKLDEVGAPGTDQQAGTAPSGQVTAQADPAQKPTMPPPAAPADPTQQPADKQTSEQGEEDWLSVLKGWVVSLLRSIFS
jgi:hypothetical protein